MLGIYIHSPFCTVHCGYCNFHVRAVGDGAVADDTYARAIAAQLRHVVERYALQGRDVGSVFFGGGTPSLMAPTFFSTILTTLAQFFAMRPDAEVTCEVNPRSGKTAWLHAVREVGVNRLSVGIQSFVPRHLTLLDRTHTADDIQRVLIDAQVAGFANVSCDLIFGIPGQTVAEVESDVRTALAFGIVHLSAYQLTFEPGTPLYKKYHDQDGISPPRLDDEEILAQMSAVEHSARATGLIRYEISNYARSGFESQHNLNYWRYGEYLGLGSGAVSFLASKRWHTTRNIEHFIAGNFSERAVDAITPRMAMGEFCFLGLRTMAGISIAEFERRFGQSFATVYPGVVDQLRASGLIACDGDRLRLTARGIEISNTVFQRFV